MQGIVMVDGDEKSLCLELAMHVARCKLERSNFTDDVDLAEAIKQDAFVKRCQAVVEMTDEFFIEFARYVTSQEQDLLSVYALLLGILVKYTKKDKVKFSSLMESLVSLLLQTSEERPLDLQLRILEYMFNSLDTHDHLRYELFKQIIRLSFRLGVDHVLISALKRLPNWFKEWQSITRGDIREMYLLLRDSFRQVNNVELSVEYGQLAMMYLDEGNLKKHEEEAREFLIEVLNSPQMFIMDYLFEIPLIQSIQGDLVYEMAHLMVYGSVEAFLTFYQTHAAKLATYQLHYEELLRKIRLLNLSQLANQTDVSYQEIADVLKIELDAVESWIIESIRFKLIEARLDQLSQTVWMKKRLFRVFQIDDWHSLADQIHEWNIRLDYILETIRTSKLEALTTAGS